MLTPAHTEMIMRVVGHLSHASSDRREVELGRIRLQALEMQLDSRSDVLRTQASMFRTLIHAVVECRVDAIRSGFSQVLSLYGEQARHYMVQQDKVLDAEINATDPLVRAGYMRRASELKLELRRIRLDAAKLYAEMNRALLVLGGSLPSFGDLDPSLMLT